jgi:hypothetical protein
LARAGNTADTTCRRCRSAPETIGHISCQCPAMKGYRIARHDGICGSVRQTKVQWHKNQGS